MFKSKGEKRTFKEIVLRVNPIKTPDAKRSRTEVKAEFNLETGVVKKWRKALTLQMVKVVDALPITPHDLPPIPQPDNPQRDNNGDNNEDLVNAPPENIHPSNFFLSNLLDNIPFLFS